MTAAIASLTRWLQQPRLIIGNYTIDFDFRRVPTAIVTIYEAYSSKLNDNFQLVLKAMKLDWTRLGKLFRLELQLRCPLDASELEISPPNTKRIINSQFEPVKKGGGRCGGAASMHEVNRGRRLACHSVVRHVVQFIQSIGSILADSITSSLWSVVLLVQLIVRQQSSRGWWRHNWFIGFNQHFMRVRQINRGRNWIVWDLNPGPFIRIPSIILDFQYLKAMGNSTNRSSTPAYIVYQRHNYPFKFVCNQQSSHQV